MPRASGTPAGRAAARGWLADPLSAGLAAATLALWVVWISASGGYYGDVWYPSTLALGAVLALVVLGARRRLAWQPPLRIALGAFLALVAVNYLSILWAGSRGSALAASNLLVLYALVALLFSALAWTPGLLAGMLGAWALAIAAFCAGGLIQATSAGNLDRFFVEFRYAVPLHYSNATAALAVMGMWPALILAARRELAPWLRALCLPVAVFLAEFALLPQSRAAVVGLLITAPLVFVCSSDRLRLLARMLVVGGGLAVSAPRTVAVDDAVSAGRHVAPVLAQAARTMLLTSLGALVLAFVLVAADSAWERRARRHDGRARGVLRAPARSRRRRLRYAWVSAGVLVVVGAVAAAPAVHREARTVIRQARHDASTGSTRLLSTTPEERFDYARVALRLFTGAPILGVGAGNFGRRYDALRRFEKHSQYTHDLALRALSETGVVGFALLALVVGALAYGLIAATVRSEGLTRACVVAAVAVAAYFLVHDSLDWLDEFPVLAAPAFAFPVAALALTGESAPTARWRPAPVWEAVRSTPARFALALIAVLACAAVYVSLSAAYLSTRYNERAQATFRANPQRAWADLHRAEKLNPLEPDPLLTEGTIALNLGNTARARSAFSQALAREDDWYPRLELALLDAEGRQFAAAAAELRAAARLDADDPVIAQAAAKVRQRQPIDPVSFNQLLFTAGAQSAIFRPENIK